MSARQRLSPYQLERLERIGFEGPVRVSTTDTEHTIGSSGIRALTRRGYVERQGQYVKITDAGARVLADAATQLELGA